MKIGNGSARGVFISGTDTGIGKTAVAAGFLRCASEFRNSRYWKPVQTGADCDTSEVARLTGLPLSQLMVPHYRFPDPLSPHLAASLAGAKICVDELTLRFTEVAHQEFIIMEGAGGLLVPLNSSTLIVDLPKRWNLPVILVAVDRLGAINQTLLSIEACQTRGVEVLGVVWNLATKEFGNAEAVAQYSGIGSLARIFKSSADNVVSEVAGSSQIRKLFEMGRPSPQIGSLHASTHCDIVSQVRRSSP